MGLPAPDAPQAEEGVGGKGQGCPYEVRSFVFVKDRP